MRRRKIISWMGFSSLLILLAIPTAAGAQTISAPQEQEFNDAKGSLAAAQKAEAEKYAPEPLKRAQELLVAADQARQSKDVVKFTQSSRLARAYAELAKAIAEFNSEAEQLAKTNEELRKVKAEIEVLKKAQ